MNPSSDEFAARQLDRYAEDFGALLAEHQTVKAQFEQALHDSQRADQIQRAIDALLQGAQDIGAVITDSEGVICTASTTAMRLLCGEARILAGQPLAHFAILPDRALLSRLIEDINFLDGGNVSIPTSFEFCRPDGFKIIGEVVRVPAPDRGFRLHWLLHTASSAIDELNRRAELFSQLYACSTNGIFVTDTAGVVLSANPAFTKITGYEESDIVGKTPHLLASGRHDQAFFRRMWQSIETDGEWQGEIWNRRKNGEIHLEWLHIRAVRDSYGAIYQYVAMLHDEGKYRNAKHRIYELANHDSLTGLPNRALFRDRLEQSISKARRENSHVGLLFVDLDRFKAVNDTLGHAIGDALLIDFSWRLVHAIRDSDTAARLGGDEFVVIAPGLAREEDIRIVAEKIIRALAQPFMLEDKEIYVGASIGVAVYPTHGENVDTILKHADLAMYAAKADGGNVCRLFNDDLRRNRAEQFDLEVGLRHALSSGELRLEYQPQVAVADGRLIGVEALLRWDWAEHGSIPPDRFIPIAEQTGLMIPMGEWVMRAACLQLADWQRAGLPCIRMAVNVTARQLNEPDFAERVLGILRETGLSPACLEVEITESQLMEKLHIGVKNLARMREHGITVAVDDFGTGYSSLGRIRTLPIDRIKVDKSFIDGISQSADCYAIANAILALANALQLEAIAEGVETEEQARVLAGIHCHTFQGYLFGRPQRPEAIAQLLEQQSGRTSC